MMTEGIWIYIEGFYWVKVSGLRKPKEFLNNLYYQGLHLWQVKVDGDRLSFRVAESDYHRLCSLGSRYACKLEVTGRAGLPCWWEAINKRRILVIGSLLLFMLLYILSSFIWLVDLSGLERLKEEELYSLLASEGLIPGVRKSSLNLKALEEEILEKEPAIAWVNIEVVGSRALVHVVEKVIPAETEGSNIYSIRDAVITKVILLQGEALVEEGDTVLAGELLVEGDEDGQAKAIIEGRTWYQARGKAREREEFNIPLQRSVTRIYLGLYGGESYKVWGPEEIPFTSYQEEVKSQIISTGRNPFSPLEIIRKDYREMMVFNLVRSPGLVEAEAREEALRSVVQSLSEGASIREMNFNIYKRDNLVQAELLLEACEEIGKTQ